MKGKRQLEPELQHSEFECASKKSKLDSYKEEKKQEEDEQYSLSLDAFPEDVLLVIFQNLRSIDLLNIGSTCKRFYRIIKDHCFWKYIDLRSCKFSLKQNKQFIKNFLQPTTVSFAIKGFADSNYDYIEKPSFSRYLLEKMNRICPNLKEFYFEEQILNGKKISITDFPENLTVLSMKGCQIFGLDICKSFFSALRLRIPNLKVLILSKCTWIRTHSLMAFSKCPNLEELRLDEAVGIESCVAYTSVAARFGFKSLKILDIRKTYLSDGDICCFDQTSTLTHLYLESPDRLNAYKTSTLSSCKEGTSGRGSTVDLQRLKCNTKGIFEVTISGFNGRRLTNIREISLIIVEGNGRHSIIDGNSSDESRNESENTAPEETTDNATTEKSESLPSVSNCNSNNTNESEPSSSKASFKESCKYCKSTFCKGTCLSELNIESNEKKKSEIQQHSKTSEAEIENDSPVFLKNSCDCSRTNQKKSSCGNKGETFEGNGDGILNSDYLLKRNENVKPIEDLSSDDDDDDDECIENNEFVHGLPKFFLSDRGDQLEQNSNLISNMGIWSFGSRRNDEPGQPIRLQWQLQQEKEHKRPHLHTLVVRNFFNVTDFSLISLQDLDSLKFLDVTGTSVTKEGIERFVSARPDVRVESSHGTYYSS